MDEGAFILQTLAPPPVVKFTNSLNHTLWSTDPGSVPHPVYAMSLSILTSEDRQQLILGEENGLQLEIAQPQPGRSLPEMDSNDAKRRLPLRLYFAQQ